MIEIEQSDKEFIEAHRHHYTMLIQAEFISNLDGSVINTMHDVIKKYFSPGYSENKWCQPCVANTVKYLYTQYDAQPKEEPVKEVEPQKQAEPTIKHETFPKHDEPASWLETTEASLNGKWTERQQEAIQLAYKDLKVDAPVLPERKKRGRKPKAK